MPDTIDHSETKALPPPQRRTTFRRSAMGAGALAAVLIAGAALGAGGTRLVQRWQPQSVMLLQPAPIGDMRGSSIVAIKGEVAEIFGNKFIVQDGSGRALIETGPRGEQRPIVAKGEPVTVQGRFDRGVVHAQVLTHADGRSEAFGPPGGPKDGPKGGPKDGPKERMKDAPGPRADRGPPPPPPADRPPPPEPLNQTDAPPPPAR